MIESIVRLESPAATWEDGLPLGNGRLAVMITGGVVEDRLTLNHERLWSNRYAASRQPEAGAAVLPAIRALLAEEKYEKATALLNQTFCPTGGRSETPARIDSFLPAGELRLEVAGRTEGEYRRELDLTTGIATVCCGRIKREYFADWAVDRIVGRIVSPVPFGCTMSLAHHWTEVRTDYENQTLRFHLRAPINVEYVICLTFSNKGEWLDNKLIFSDLTELTYAIDIRVVPERDCSALPPLDWGGAREAHLAFFQKYFSAFDLTLPSDSTLAALPLEIRRTRRRTGQVDVGLMLLFFNFSRYLLASASGHGELPPHLQGKWNAEPIPPWRSDYHLDINLQMNLWPAEPLSMHQLSEQFFSLLEKALPAAREAAKTLWGCRGIWFPWALDLSDNTTPEGCGWGVSTMTAPWLAQHYWEHYEYTLDHNFLVRRAYPFLKECALFFEDFLVEGEDGLYHLMPSMSPENPFGEAGDWPVGIAVDCAGELEAVAEVLENVCKAASILNCDQDKQMRWREIGRRLPSLKIGDDGRIMEWGRQFTETDPGHRHLSHLYALFPGNQINAAQTPLLYAAARVTLARRLAAFGGQTGWSAAWASCCYAALHDGESALAQLEQLLLEQCSDVLMGLHPPHIFQIDANCGTLTAMLNMLFRVENEILKPLPALPPAWSSGKIAGLAVRGGYTVTMEWTDGILQTLRLRATRGEVCRLDFNGELKEFTVEQGHEYEFKAGTTSIACLDTEERKSFGF